MIMPTRTLAAILLEQQKPLVIAEIELPETLDIGQVLVEFFYSGICGSQLGEIAGVKGLDKWLPHLLGHEASGKVLAIGPGVRHVKPGDHVVAHWRPSLGIEANTPKYRWNGQTVNAGWVTTFNQFGVISENRLTAIPAETDLKAAALYGCAITTGFGTIDNVAKIRLGESVVVFGAGGVGLNIVQAASLAGASTIIAIDRFDGRLALASRCGASACINSETQDPWDAISEILAASSGKKKTLDVFIDNTGNASIIARGYETVGPDGRVVLVGVPRSGDRASIYTLGLHFGRSITGTTGGEAKPHEDIGRYMALAKARKIDFSSLITEVAPLVDVNRLIDDMGQGKSAGRSLISFGS
jgi:S-(hydroxymethyl)glutathione dehydrogenase/alcohol dehydrogenase